MRARLTWIAISVVIATALAIPSATEAHEDEPDATVAAAELAPEQAEARGTCATPRQAWLQLLYWSGKQQWQRAAICFDKTGLTERESAELAERLFDHLNANGLLIDTRDPETASAGYLDPESGEPSYSAPPAPAFVIQRFEDGKWRFSGEALAAIPGFSLGKRLGRQLPTWLQKQVLGVPAWSYLGIVMLVLFAFAARRFAMFFINRYIRRWAKRAKLTYVDQLTDRIDGPMGGLSMAAVFYLGFPLLSFPVRASGVALVATKALAAFSMVWLAYRLIDVLAGWLASRADTTESKLDDQLVPLVRKTLKVFVSILGGIFILQNLQVNVSSLLAGVGLGGLAFALAAKDTVANFFGSVMIFIDKPFQIGDWVEVDDAEGTVEEVGFRTTKIRTFYNSRITLPNSIIANTKVDNYGERKYRRYVANLGLTYDTPPQKVQAFCEAVRAAIARLEGMRKDYYLVEFKEFGDSALVIMLYCFMIAKSWNDELRIRTRLNLEILRISAELGVDFAFPTQTLHVDSLAQPQPPRAKAPAQSADELASIISSFAPGGEKGREGFEISAGYDCRESWVDPAQSDVPSAEKRRAGEGAGADG